MKTRKIALMGLLAAIALTIFTVEAQIPGLIPVPGIKPGLSNIVTVWAVFALGPWEAVAILAVRILLGAAVTGQLSAIVYSGAGGLCAIAVTILLRRIVSRKQLWAASACAAMGHSFGQMAAAIAITRTPEIAVYLPLMLVCSIVAGVFTGLCAQFLLERLKFQW